MKRVTKPINFRELTTLINKKTNESISGKIDRAYNSMPQLFFIFQNFWFKVLIFSVGIILFIPIFWYWHLVKKYNRRLLNNINQNEIFKDAIDIVPKLSDFSTQRFANTKDLFIYRHNGIPGDAWISKGSIIWKFKINNKHEAISRVGLATWKRTINGKVQYFSSPTGYIKVMAPQVMPGFNYNLKHRRKFLGKKATFENQFFNEYFSFKGNDEIKARMIYTPLAMEMTLSHSRMFLKKQNVTVDKRNGAFVLKYRPFSYQSHEINLSMNSVSGVTAVKNTIIRDVSRDIIEMYKVIYMILIPPML